MAFRMTRPIVQGTDYHKASVLLKTKAGTVAQTRTTADATLVSAASVLGQSNIPKVPDFTIKQAAINIPEGGGGEKKPREKKTESENFNTYVEFMQSQRLDNQIMSEDDWRKLSRRKQKNLIEPKTEERTSEQKTNDAIYNNAFENGIVQNNMIKDGYTPPKDAVPPHEEETVTGVANENGDAPGGEVTEVAPTPKGNHFTFSGRKGDPYKYRSVSNNDDNDGGYEFQRPGSDAWEVAKPGKGKDAIHKLWMSDDKIVDDITPFFKKSPLKKGIGRYAKKAKGSRNYKMNK